MSLASPHPLGHCHLPPLPTSIKHPARPGTCESVLVLSEAESSWHAWAVGCRSGLPPRPSCHSWRECGSHMARPGAGSAQLAGVCPRSRGLGQRQSPSHTFPSPSNSGLIRRHLSGAPGKDTVPVRACPCILVSCPRASLCSCRGYLAMVWGQVPMPCQLVRTHTSRQPWLPQGKDCPDNHMDTEPGPTGPTHTAPAHTPAHWGLTRAPSRTQDQQVSPHQTLTRT